MTQVTPTPLAASYVAAFVPDETGQDAVALGRFLVTGTDISLAVSTVVPHTATGGRRPAGLRIRGRRLDAHPGQRTHRCLQPVTFVFSEYPLFSALLRARLGQVRYHCPVRSRENATRSGRCICAGRHRGRGLRAGRRQHSSGSRPSRVARRRPPRAGFGTDGSFRPGVPGIDGLKLLRCCPVPVIAVPRPATCEAAADSDRADIDGPENK